MKKNLMKKTENERTSNNWLTSIRPNAYNAIIVCRTREGVSVRLDTVLDDFQDHASSFVVSTVHSYFCST
jgi:hypothetical protein